MDCGEIKKYLSSYIDGMLNEFMKALIDEHLSTCSDCSNEVAELRTCVKELGSMEQIKAPGDFLEKVHKRLERSSEFDGMMKKAFTPDRKKLTIRLAAIAGTVFVFVLVLNVTLFRKSVRGGLSRDQIVIAKKYESEEVFGIEERKTIAQSGVVKNGEAPGYFGAAGGGVSEDDDLEVSSFSPTYKSSKKALADTVDYASFDASARAKEEEPIELALLIRPEVLREEARSGEFAVYKEKESIDDKKEMMRQVSMRGTSRDKSDRRRVLRKEAPVVEGVQAKSVKRQSLRRTDTDKYSPVQEKAELHYLDKAILDIDKLIKDLKGKRIKMKFGKAPDPALYLTAVIPSKNYVIFLKKLGVIGELRKPSPFKVKKDEKSVLVHLRILPVE